MKETNNQEEREEERLPAGISRGAHITGVLKPFLKNQCICKLRCCILAECNLSNGALSSAHSWMNSLSTPEI